MNDLELSVSILGSKPLAQRFAVIMIEGRTQPSMWPTELQNLSMTDLFVSAPGASEENCARRINCRPQWAAADDVFKSCVVSVYWFRWRQSAQFSNKQFTDLIVRI